MHELLEVAKDAALRAAGEIMRFYEGVEFAVKEDGSPVTVADRAAHDTIASILTETGIPVLSEEGERSPLPYPERLWVVDPLDGTRDFIGKTGDFAVMIGLLEGGRPALGAVMLPVEEKLYFALKGEGAYMKHNGSVRALSLEESERPLTCIRSMNHMNARSQAVIDELGAAAIPHGSIGVKAGLIAEGVGDFCFSWGALGEWDVCAPEIILTEAGGIATDMKGRSLAYGTEDHRIRGGMLFSHKKCHERVLAAVERIEARGSREVS